MPRKDFLFLKEKLSYHTAIADSLRGFDSRGNKAEGGAGFDTAHAVEARVSSLEEAMSAEDQRLEELEAKVRSLLGPTRGAAIFGGASSNVRREEQEEPNSDRQVCMGCRVCRRVCVGEK